MFPKVCVCFFLGGVAFLWDLQQVLAVVGLWDGRLRDDVTRRGGHVGLGLFGWASAGYCLVGGLGGDLAIVPCRRCW